jgi:hypothetical protein
MKGASFEVSISCLKIAQEAEVSVRTASTSLQDLVRIGVLVAVRSSRSRKPGVLEVERYRTVRAHLIPPGSSAEVSTSAGVLARMLAGTSFQRELRNAPRIVAALSRAFDGELTAQAISSATSLSCTAVRALLSEMEIRSIVEVTEGWSYHSHPERRTSGKRMRTRPAPRRYSTRRAALWRMKPRSDWLNDVAQLVDAGSAFPHSPPPPLSEEDLYRLLDPSQDQWIPA